MMLVVAPVLLSLTLTAGLEQKKPDFSGKWTKIPSSAGEAVETMTISQTANTLTVEETRSPSGVIRWVQKLDGSESKNVMKPANAPEHVQVSTTVWDGDSLVTRTPVQGRRSAVRAYDGHAPGGGHTRHTRDANH